MTRRNPLPPALRTYGFTVQEAVALTGRGRLRASDLRTLHRGVRMPSRAGDSFAVHTASLALVMPPAAFFCGTSAAEIHGIPLPPSAVFPSRGLEVGVPSEHRALRRRGIIGRKLRVREADLTAVHGRLVTTPARTWCDLATSLDVPHLVAAGDWLIRAGAATRAELGDAVEDHPGRRFRGRLRLALRLLDERAESPKESELRAIVVLAGLPVPTPQVVVSDEFGRFVARGDLVFEDYGEVREYQGDHHRTDRAQWRRDRTREAEIEATGRHVTEVTDDDLAHPEALLRRLEANLRRRGWDGPRTPMAPRP
ncbi:hypothetical protein ET445_16205 [Agromyces protaetiae]|uniref:DUF559 domain-containing protein n=1 Tax=Agromyces protaetiae TaxID=2509455 RepID=A0A4P6FEN0_9MICO|nr:hypothetical protein [Agromyces protaetiae]QAY74642.1 hypothetical protein ET445_16205 [Agromyces protaetiae]